MTESSMAESPLLEVEDLRVRFRALRDQKEIFLEAVRGVSFSVAAGEILGILGESGSGKSVTTQAIPGLLPANALVSGSIRYQGIDLGKLEQKELRAFRGKRIGMIYQEPGRSCDPLQNVESMFLETLRNSNPGVSREESAEQALRLLAEAGLENGRERLKNFPHQFSGGQLQRIGIALALAQNCELLVADEPVTALDVTIQRQIVTLLRNLQKKRNISIIFISHDMDLVADISGRIMVMYGGLVMESGPADLIHSAPQHPYAKALAGASPRFGSHHSRERLVPIPGKAADGTKTEKGCPFAPRCAEALAECYRRVPALLNSVSADNHLVRCFRLGGEPCR